VRGNERGQARVRRAAELLEEIGLESERLGMFFMSGSQAHTFAAAAQTMTERIRKLGPNPLKNGQVKVKESERGVEVDEDIGFRGRKL
jgi:coenzyme F420-reducing hydrogenase delta subunit